MKNKQEKTDQASPEVHLSIRIKKRELTEAELTQIAGGVSVPVEGIGLAPGPQYIR